MKRIDARLTQAERKLPRAAGGHNLRVVYTDELTGATDGGDQ